jgi:hypothetical protein
VFPSGTRDNNEDKKEEKPGAILVPAEGWKPPKSFLMMWVTMLTS